MERPRPRFYGGVNRAGKRVKYVGGGMWLLYFLGEDMILARTECVWRNARSVELSKKEKGLLF